MADSNRNPESSQLSWSYGNSALLLLTAPILRTSYTLYKTTKRQSSPPSRGLIRRRQYTDGTYLPYPHSQTIIHQRNKKNYHYYSSSPHQGETSHLSWNDQSRTLVPAPSHVQSIYDRVSSLSFLFCDSIPNYVHFSLYRFPGIFICSSPLPDTIR